jgi:GxxExxY protein
MELNNISGAIVDAAMKVHSQLGPGLLESAYVECLGYELNRRGVSVQSQVVLPVHYDGKRIDAGYRIDLLVDDIVIVELKVVEQLLPIHKAQLLSYLRLSNKRLGVLVNFNQIHLKDGIKRIINGFREH